MASNKDPFDTTYRKTPGVYITGKDADADTYNTVHVDANGHLFTKMVGDAGETNIALACDADGKLLVSGTVSSKTALTASAPTAASVGITSASAVAANANRKGLILVNTSSNYISLGIGAAAVLYSGITLNPGGGAFWMDEYSFSTAAIYAIASGAASNIGVTEFV